MPLAHLSKRGAIFNEIVRAPNHVPRLGLRAGAGEALASGSFRVDGNRENLRQSVP